MQSLFPPSQKHLQKNASVSGERKRREMASPVYTSLKLVIQRKKRTGNPASQHAGLVVDSLASVFSDSFPLAFSWYQTSMHGILDTLPAPQAPIPRGYCLNSSLLSILDCPHKPPMTLPAQPMQPWANCFDILHPWGQITVATAISVALQPPFLVCYTEMLPLLSNSCWINLVNSSWPEKVRSY